jgi:hypothetical protein
MAFEIRKCPASTVPRGSGQEQFLFFDTSNNNLLSTRLDDGTILVIGATNTAPGIEHVSSSLGPAAQPVPTDTIEQAVNPALTPPREGRYLVTASFQSQSQAGSQEGFQEATFQLGKDVDGSVTLGPVCTVEIGSTGSDGLGGPEFHANVNVPVSLSWVTDVEEPEDTTFAVYVTTGPTNTINVRSINIQAIRLGDVPA